MLRQAFLGPLQCVSQVIENSINGNWGIRFLLTKNGQFLTYFQGRVQIEKLVFGTGDAGIVRVGDSLETRRFSYLMNQGISRKYLEKVHLQAGIGIPKLETQLIQGLALVHLEREERLSFSVVVRPTKNRLLEVVEGRDRASATWVCDQSREIDAFFVL